MIRREGARLRQIISVLIRHGLRKGFTDPAELRQAFEELGPTFVKIGQILSARPDLLTENYRLELRKLQDEVKPETYEDIRRVVERELGASLEELFRYFSTAPVACASVAQVHRAALLDGRPVVVKVQRPGLRAVIENDLDLLRRLAGLARFAPRGGVLNLPAVVGELRETLRRELDFRLEARNIERFAANNRAVKYVSCPRVYESYSTGEVLVMEEIGGIRLDERERLIREGYDPAEIGAKLARNYCRQVFVDGFFHADPHPGNILIQGGRIFYLDFGIMGSLDQVLQNRINRLIRGIATRDAGVMTQAVLRLLHRRGSIDQARLRMDIEELCRGYLDAPLFDLDLARLAEEIFELCRSHNLAIPSGLFMLLKGMVTIEGVVARLAPELSLMEVIASYARRHLPARRDFLREQVGNLQALALLGPKIPLRFLDVLNAALAGSLRTRLVLGDLERSLGALSKMANRIVFALITAALIIGSSLIIMADVGPKIHGLSALGLVGYVGAAVMGLWLLISMIKSGMM